MTRKKNLSADTPGKVQKLADKIKDLSPTDRELAKEIVTHLARPTADIFEWANRTDAYKNELDIELFFFNKNYTPYAVELSNSVLQQLRPLFLYDLINYVNLGVGTGLQVRYITEGDPKAQNILNYLPLEKVGRAETIVHLIENERDDILFFSQEEHDLKRMKGVVARFTHPTDSSVKFYAMKLLKSTDIVVSAAAWQFAHGKFDSLLPEAVLKAPADNQVLVMGGYIFAFDPAKFAKLFNFDARALETAEKIGAEIDKQYGLSMPTIGQGIAFMACEKPGLLKKLLQVEPGLVPQDKVIDVIDELAIELMVDDAGKIILMDYEDVSTFLDILLDNFYASEATGQHYVAKSKKVIGEE